MMLSCSVERLAGLSQLYWQDVATCNRMVVIQRRCYNAGLNTDSNLTGAG